MAEPGAGQPRGLGREIAMVLAIGAVAVALVLGAVVLTAVLPRELQEVVFHTPLAILVLVVGTVWLLWRISRRSGSR